VKGLGYAATAKTEHSLNILRIWGMNKESRPMGLSIFSVILSEVDVREADVNATKDLLLLEVQPHTVLGSSHHEPSPS
jgi:hypothetical protein